MSPSDYLGLHSRYEKILESAPIELASNIPDDDQQRLKEKFTSMMQALYTEKGSQLRIDILADSEVQDFINAHAEILDSAMQRTHLSDIMRSRLERSNYIFSGVKTFHELNEAFPSLLDDSGKRKPFEHFLNDVQKVDERYNRNYLRAEYNFVNASADMAAKWEEFAQDGDRYNLQYRTAGDEKVRPEHAELNGVTLSIDDPFWREYFPPNGWNCRCTVVQVRKSKYPETPHEEAMHRGANATGKDEKGIFHFNSGLEQKSVPDYNPYTIRRCRDCDIAKGKTNLAFVPENELCQACRLLHQCETKRFNVIKEFGNGGRVSAHQHVNSEDSDYDKLMEVATFFAKTFGEDVKLTPKMSRPPKFVYQNIYSDLMGTVYEGKCPDLLVGNKWYEHEGFTTDKAKRAFSNMLNHGLKQSSRIIIDKPNLTDAYMKRNINQRIKEGQIINEIWIREKSGIRLFYKKFEE